MLHSGKVAISNGKETKFVFVEEIMYFRSNGNSCIVHLVNEKPILLSKSLKEIFSNLPVNSFFRIHHSYVINLTFASKFVDGGEDYVVMMDESKLPVSRRKKAGFLAWFNKL